jgi:glycosyltransferase involved in cell wall biosynthesis
MTQTPTPSRSDAPILSVVVPALDEQDNVAPLCRQVAQHIVAQGIAAELIIVDDGSTDATPARLRALRGEYPWLRVLRRSRPQGQSAAMYAGIQAARGQWIATLDADLQNDPADLPKMLAICQSGAADMVQGDRSRNRRDNFIRRRTSGIGRATRKMLLGDSVRDTGCSARVVRADIAKQYPLIFKGIHRFLPVYAKMLGARIVEMPVNHRPRTAGQTKYGLGILKRGLSGFFDCLSVRWMLKRYRDPAVEEIHS